MLASYRSAWRRVWEFAAHFCWLTWRMRQSRHRRAPRVDESGNFGTSSDRKRDYIFEHLKHTWFFCVAWRHQDRQYQWKLCWSSVYQSKDRGEGRRVVRRSHHYGWGHKIPLWSQESVSVPHTHQPIAAMCVSLLAIALPAHSRLIHRKLDDYPVGQVSMQLTLWVLALTWPGTQPSYLWAFQSHLDHE